MLVCKPNICMISHFALKTKIETKSVLKINARGIRTELRKLRTLSCRRSCVRNIHGLPHLLRCSLQCKPSPWLSAGENRATDMSCHTANPALLY